MPKVLANAHIVVPEDVVYGSLTLENGIIADIDGSRHVGRNCIDLEGDYLLPGLIDLHSDHLEKQFVPRPNVQWHSLSAALSHDAQVVAAGITTVFDSLALTGMKAGIDRALALPLMIEGLRQALGAGVMRADHLLHIRCEVTEADILERFAPFDGDPLVRLISLMDHSPGQRQFPNMEIWLSRHRAATGLNDEQLNDLKDRRLEAQYQFADRHRVSLASIAAKRGLVVASHDDSTEEHVLDGQRLGIRISEFPTTPEAAIAARSHGILVLMGAPNLVRGGSHVGNLSAVDCTKLGLLDLLASDYVPAALMHAVFLLTQKPVGMELSAAVATASSAPARACGLSDRGSIVVGQRADLVQVRLLAGIPVVQRVWRYGFRVH